MQIVFQHLIATKRQNSVKDESGEEVEDGKKKEGGEGGEKLEQKLNMWCKIIFPGFYTLSVTVLFLASL